MTNYYWWPVDGNVYLRLSNGDNSFPNIIAVPWSTNSNDNPVGFADINGDRIADLYGWSSDGNIKVKLGYPVMPDLITAVTNGLGEQWQLGYKSLGDDSVYAPAPVQVYPYRMANDTTWVVRTAGKSDGLGGIATTYYRYGGQLMHLSADERLGFAWIQRAEPDGSWANDFYNQDVNRFGTLSESQTFVPGGVMVKHVTNTWILGTLDYNRILVRLSESAEATYELDGNMINRATTTTSYDGYGYPLTTTVQQLDGRKKTTVNTYRHDETYWTLGLKTLEQVTAEAPGFAPETRTTDYSYYPGNGLLALERTEPTDSAYTLGKSYGYDVFGNLIRTTISGPNIATRETTHVYDGTGRFRAKTTNALGHYETVEYDPRNGEPTKHTGPNKLITTWGYDGLGRKLSELRPDSTTTTFGYAACVSSCPPLAVTRFTITPAGKSASISYRDMLGREVQTATQGLNGNWIYKTTQYDNLGRIAQVSSPYFLGETPLYAVNEYDLLNRVKKVTAPGNRVTTTAYNGLRATVTNPLNQATTTVKDSEGRVIDVVDAASGHTRSSYDAFGNLISTTDPAGNVTTMRYDRLGRKTEINDPDRGRWTYTYNVLGELKTQTDAKGQITSYTYDKLGRRKTRAAPEGQTTWFYDIGGNAVGRLFYVSAPGYQEWHQYDVLGREYYTAQNIGGLDYVVTRSFDQYSRIDVLTYPSGYLLKHSYDDYGHLVELKDAQNNQSYWRATAADARGHVTEEQLAGGTLTATHAYHPDTGLPEVSQVTSPTAQVRYDSYAWNVGDNLAWRMQYTGSAHIIETFRYDNLNRLKSVTGPVNKSFQYDAAGNLTYKSDVGAYSYPALGGVRPHAVSSISGAINTSFTYDANGNLLTGNGRTVTYTSYNQPATITQGGTTAALSYDANFRRVIKTVAGRTTHYIDGGRYERVTDGSIVITHRHHIYAGRRPIALYTYWTVNGIPSDPQVTYLHADPQGSIEATTGADGTVQRHLAYDAWGLRRNPDGTDAAGNLGAPVKRGYTGAEHDDELKLINLNAREYDPFLGRFLQPDPLGIEGDPHPYAYANNNPLKYTDPTGTSFVYMDSFAMGGTPSLNLWEQGAVNMARNERNKNYNAPYLSLNDKSWSSFNSSSSNSVFGNNGPSLTTFNTNWNGGGLSFMNIFDSVGAGQSTGTPDWSFLRNNVPAQAVSQPANGRNAAFSVTVGTSYLAGNVGGRLDSGIIFDTTGTMCFVANRCGRVGPGLAGSIGASAGASPLYQPLTSGSFTTHGGFVQGGPLIYHDLDYGIARDRLALPDFSMGIPGLNAGAGRGSGYEQCNVWMLCND